jgi:broad specificity phosphatase PhoE
MPGSRVMTQSASVAPASSPAPSGRPFEIPGQYLERRTLSSLRRPISVVGEVNNSMNHPLPLFYLARHGETEWSITGQHTGWTDLPLTVRGERNARRLGERLHGSTFGRVFTSPLQRASQTCELAGFGTVATAEHDLVEWNYGDFEGQTRAEIHKQRPDWDVFRDGCPGGESVADVAGRADRVVARMRAADGNVLLFSHGHFLRVLAARWLGLDPGAGRYLFLSTAALSIVGYEHARDDPAIRLWNDCRHEGD